MCEKYPTLSIAVLKDELRFGDRSLVLQFLKEKSERGDGESDSVALFRTYTELQASEEWKGARDILNPLMRESLEEARGRFGTELSRSRRADGKELVTMGKLYERYLDDRPSAADCYLKVIRRYLGRRLPQTANEWKAAYDRAIDSEDLNADEKYSFKRLSGMKQLEESVEGRLLSAVDRKIREAEKALGPPRDKPVFDPNESVPFEEIRKQFLEGGNQ